MLFLLLLLFLNHLSIKGCHTGSVDDAASVSVLIRFILSHRTNSKANHIKSSSDVHLQGRTSGRNVTQERLSV